MLPFARNAVRFALIVLSAFVIASAIYVYELGMKEAAWGAGATFQLCATVSLGVSLLSLFAVGAGCRFAGPRLELSLAALFGTAAVFVGCTVYLVVLLPSFASASHDPAVSPLLVLGVWTLLAPAALGFAASKWWGRFVARNV